MLPTSEEDRLKLKVYKQLIGSYNIGTIEFTLAFRQAYEKEKHAKHWISFFRKNSLEEELMSFAYTYLQTPINKRRNVDAKALKLIVKREKCRRVDKTAIHYFKIYNHIKKSLGDLKEGIAYIEDRVEFDEVDSLNKFEDNTLEGQLAKLALKYKESNESKKRKIDYEALAIIKRCSSCRKSPGLTRYYYRFYRGRAED